MHERARVPEGLAVVAGLQDGVFSTAQAVQAGLSRQALASARVGLWAPVGRGVWVLTPADRPTPVAPWEATPLAARQRAWAVQLVSGRAVACDELAATLLDLDRRRGWPASSRHSAPRSVWRRPGWRARDLPADAVVDVEGLRVTSPLQTLCDLAPSLAANELEAALESAQRRGLFDVPASAPAALRIVAARRPPGTPTTDSLLEVLALQAARRAGLPEPHRQVVVVDRRGRFVARVDLAWPELGLFLELDGEHHRGQPLYDAARQTSIVAATGWRVARFTWTEIVHTPRHCERRLCQLAALAA